MCWIAYYQSIMSCLILVLKRTEEWFKQFSSKKAQLRIIFTDKWIIQIAYGKLIIMAKNNGDTYF